jgi:hypothetical protein
MQRAITVLCAYNIVHKPNIKINAYVSVQINTAERAQTATASTVIGFLKDFVRYLQNLTRDTFFLHVGQICVCACVCICARKKERQTENRAQKCLKIWQPGKFHQGDDGGGSKLLCNISQ